jgi:hypothetical protein
MASASELTSAAQRRAGETVQAAGLFRPREAERAGRAAGMSAQHLLIPRATDPLRVAERMIAAQERAAHDAGLAMSMLVAVTPTRVYGWEWSGETAGRELFALDRGALAVATHGGLVRLVLELDDHASGRRLALESAPFGASHDHARDVATALTQG